MNSFASYMTKMLCAAATIVLVCVSLAPADGKLGATVINTDMSGGELKVGGSLTLPPLPQGVTTKTSEEMVAYAKGFLKYIENQVPEGLKMYDGTEPEVDVQQLGDAVAATLRSAEDKARKDLGERYGASDLPAWFRQQHQTLRTLRTSATARVGAAEQARAYIAAFINYNKKVEAKKKTLRETAKELAKSYQAMEAAIAAGGERMRVERDKFRAAVLRAKTFETVLVRFKKDVEAVAKDDPVKIVLERFLDGDSTIVVTDHMKSEKSIMAALEKWNQLRGALVERSNELYKEFMERTKSTREEKWFFRDAGKPMNGIEFKKITDTFKELYVRAGG